MIFGRHIAKKYDEAIRTLGNVQIGYADGFGGYDKLNVRDEAIYFRFTDPGSENREWAFGVVMPLSQNGEC